MGRKELMVTLWLMLVATVSIAALADTSRYAIADTVDLLSFPQVASSEQRVVKQQLFAILLPETESVLIMRPITESEYGSFQVQAIGYQIIEQEMLAAAIVMPVVTPADVAALAPDLVTFLQLQVNEISGFDVFSVISPDAP